MKWPFVTRVRFDELKTQYVELKEAHERIVDAAYFLQAGFHLYARFDEKPVIEASPQPAKVEAKSEDPPATMRSAINMLEAKALSEFEEKQRSLKALSDANRMAAAAKFEATLHEADQKAQGAD